MYIKETSPKRKSFIHSYLFILEKPILKCHQFDCETAVGSFLFHFEHFENFRLKFFYSFHSFSEFNQYFFRAAELYNDLQPPPAPHSLHPAPAAAGRLPGGWRHPATTAHLLHLHQPLPRCHKLVI